MTKTGNHLLAIMRKFLFFGIASLLFSVGLFESAAKAEVKVQASVPQNELGLGDTVVLTVTVSSDSSFEAQDPTPPPFEGLSLINSWNSSSTSSKLMQTPSGMQFQTQRRQEFNFMLSPSRTGKLNIGIFQVVVDGKKYSTKPISILVSKNGSGAGRQKQVPGMPDLDEIDQADQVFQQLLQRHMQTPTPPAANKLNNHNPNEAFFIQAEADKTSAFEGEQVTVSWYIYTRGNMMSLDRLKFPELKGFWKEIIEEVPALNFTQEVLNGVPYRRALLATHALFPIKAGEAVIDEYKIKASVQLANGSFGFGPAYTYTRASERIKITVKPLPTENKPKDFTGAVGQFDLSAAIEAQNFATNQPFSLKVRFDGVGNAKSIDLPPLNLPPGLEIYDTKNDTKFFKNGRSYKEFEVLIIPRQVGDFSIPAVDASMFDPKLAKYYTRSTQALNIHVSMGKSVADSANRLQGVNPSTQPKEINRLPEPVMSFERPNIDSQGKQLLQFLLWLMVILILLWKGKREFSVEKTKSILGEFKKRTQVIKKLLDQGDWRKVGTETANLIYFVLGEISGQGGASLEVHKLLELSPPSLRRELGEALQKHIEFFQVLGFAPEASVGAYKESSELSKQVQQTIKTLEKALEMAQKND